MESKGESCVISHVIGLQQHVKTFKAEIYLVQIPPHEISFMLLYNHVFILLYHK